MRRRSCGVTPSFFSFSAYPAAATTFAARLRRNLFSRHPIPLVDRAEDQTFCDARAFTPRVYRRLRPVRHRHTSAPCRPYRAATPVNSRGAFFYQNELYTQGTLSTVKRCDEEPSATPISRTAQGRLMPECSPTSRSAATPARLREFQ
jgi:hypothetical protein